MRLRYLIGKKAKILYLINGELHGSEERILNLLLIIGLIILYQYTASSYEFDDLTGVIIQELTRW